MRQPAQDRALYYRQLRDTVATVFVPELTSAAAQDAAALVERILAQFIVEQEWAPALSEEYGRALAAELEPVATVPDPITPEGFAELRRRAAAYVRTCAASDRPDERARCRRLIAAEHRFLERVDELRQGVMDEVTDIGPARSPVDRSVTEDELGAWLRRRFPDSPGLVVTNLDLVPGGRSKETLVVSLTGTNELPPEVIVRKDRAVGVLQTRAADEFAVLAAVYAHGGVPVPRPFVAAPVDEGDGAETLLVMERVPGRKAGEYFPELSAPPASHRRALGRQLATALAHLHAISLDELRGTNLDLDTEVTAAGLQAAVVGMMGRLDELSGPPLVGAGLAGQWLLDHVDDVVPAGRPCLLQGDVGLHNMLVSGDRLVALVDWEAATVGPAARELAAAWPAATALMEWSEFVVAYCAAGGAEEAATTAAVTYYRVFFALGACLSSRTGGHLFRSGAKRDLVTAHSGLDAHFRAQRNLARALADAGDGPAPPD